jgi:hypothetical protein
MMSRGSWAEARRIADVLRKETVGGALLLAGSVVALIWASSPWSDRYQALLASVVGPSALHLNLSLKLSPERLAIDGALDQILEAVANPHRRDILRVLGLQPCAISELARMRGLPFPAIHNSPRRPEPT